MLSWQTLALLALLGMETAAFAPWMHNVSPAISAVPLGRFAWLVFLIPLATYALNRLTAALHLKKSARQAASAGVLAVSVWAALHWWIDPAAAQDMQALYRQPLKGIEEAPLVIPAWFWALAFAFGLWWRGAMLERGRLGPLAVMRSFKAGIFSLTIFVFAEYVTRPAAPDFSAGLLFIFLACALLALMGSRVSVLERLRGGHRNSFDLRWMGTAGSAALLWALASIGGGLLLAGRVDFLGRVVEYLAVGLGALMAAPFLLLLALIQPAFDALVQKIPQVEGTPVPTPAAPELPDFTSLQQAADKVPPDMRPVFLTLGGLALAALVVWVLRATAERLENPAARPAFEDAPESETLAEGLRRRFGALAEKLRGAAGLSARERRRAAERIRQLYADFVEACARQGVARPPAVTPWEFVPLTESILPASRQDVRLLTEAYVRVRYGELPETEAEIRGVEAAWKRVQEALQKGDNKKPAA